MYKVSPDTCRVEGGGGGGGGGGAGEGGIPMDDASIDINELMR